jgi:hypothetical protein
MRTDSAVLDVDDQWSVTECLEQLDDVVFDALRGSPAALAHLELLWPSAIGSLGYDVLAESREQYLRKALSIWHDFFDAEGRRSDSAMAALDVLCVLFSE